MSPLTQDNITLIVTGMPLQLLSDIPSENDLINSSTRGSKYESIDKDGSFGPGMQPTNMTFSSL